MPALLGGEAVTGERPRRPGLMAADGRHLRDYRRRRRLERRAYPDPLLVAHWRRTTKALFAVAFVLGVAHLYLAAVIVLLITVPRMVRYIRQQWALGAVMAAEGYHVGRVQMPDTDLRAVYRRVG